MVEGFYKAVMRMSADFGNNSQLVDFDHITDPIPRSDKRIAVEVFWIYMTVYSVNISLWSPEVQEETPSMFSQL